MKLNEDVFVYGTLKKGFGNNRVMERAGGTLWASATTKDRYPLYVEGLPYLSEEAGIGHNVRGEIWSVEDLAPLDRLEGHPSFYKRKRVYVIANPSQYKDEEVALKVWAYFIQSTYYHRNFSSEPVEEYRANCPRFEGNFMLGTFYKPLPDGSADRTTSFICGCAANGERIWTGREDDLRFDPHLDWHRTYKAEFGGELLWPHINGKELIYEESA